MTSPHQHITTSNFQGLAVAAFESRMASEMERLIRRYGGEPLVAPALQEVPLEDNSAALRFGARLLTDRIDILILLTGVGTKLLFDIVQTRHRLPDIVAALRHTALIARGPKPRRRAEGVGTLAHAHGPGAEYLARSYRNAGRISAGKRAPGGGAGVRHVQR